MTYAVADEQETPRWTRAVQWIVALNLAVYFLQITVVGAANMQLALGFTSRNLTSASWTVLTVGTYMFVHGGFWHLALNMYTLYLFGRRVEQSWSPGEFTRYYLLCGLGGWFFHLLFAREGLLVGASAAVLGVALAYATRWPDDEIYVLGVIPMKVKWLMALIVGVNLLGGIAGGGAGSGVAYLAHLGGLATGWLYLRSSSVASIDRLRQRVSAIPDVPDELPRAVPRSLPRSRGRETDRSAADKPASDKSTIDEIVAQSNAAVGRRLAAAQRPALRVAERMKDIDSVLDKISARGIESLTTEERQMLEDRARQLRSEQ
jgi:membrane associated rhomboid family serine protease